MNLPQHCGTLLQAEYNILLHQRKLHIRGQHFELCQLPVRLRQQALLVLFAPESELRLVGVTAPEAFFRDLGLAGGDYSYALLVLMQLVALVLHVQDRPTATVSKRHRKREKLEVILILRRDLVRAVRVAHDGVWNSAMSEKRRLR